MKHSFNKHSRSSINSNNNSNSNNCYLTPTLNSIQPVYSDLLISWNSNCSNQLLQSSKGGAGTSSTSSSSSGGLIDIYLTILDPINLENKQVHLFNSIKFESSSFLTQFKLNWWNNTLLPGNVSAQLTIVPTNNPIWNTPVSAGPIFTITYNGTYPASISNSNPSLPSANTGSSTGGGGGTSSAGEGGLSGGKIALAVLLPLLTILIAVGSYVIWNKRKKKPEQKRWSAVVDKRVSMISQGTYQSRPQSMALGGGGGGSSFHRPSGSIHTPSNRLSYFVDGRPNSTYSVLSGQQISSSTSGNSPGAKSRELPPPDMRQIGVGDRISRVSFTVDDSSPSKKNIGGGGGGNSSRHQRGQPSSSSSSSKYSTTNNQAGTTLEELAVVSSTDSIFSEIESPTPPSRILQSSSSSSSSPPYTKTKSHHKHHSSIGSSLRQELSSTLPIPVPPFSLADLPNTSNSNQSNNNYNHNGKASSFMTAPSRPTSQFDNLNFLIAQQQVPMQTSTQSSTSSSSNNNSSSNDEEQEEDDTESTNNFYTPSPGILELPSISTSSPPSSTSASTNPSSLPIPLPLSTPITSLNPDEAFQNYANATHQSRNLVITTNSNSDSDNNISGSEEVVENQSMRMTTTNLNSKMNLKGRGKKFLGLFVAASSSNGSTTINE